jgi:hypothetical protein
VSEKEALHYLELRGIDRVPAAQIYELVGGRMIHLRFIADNIMESEESITLQGM